MQECICNAVIWAGSNGGLEEDREKAVSKEFGRRQSKQYG